MSAHGLRVLLIEDNPIDVRLVQEYFRDSLPDATLIYADSLLTGLQSLRSAPVDIVLLDLMLPDCTGLATVFAVRAVAGHIPIVILSGVDNEADAVEAVRQGAQDYLVKSKTDAEGLGRALRFAVERAARVSRDVSGESIESGAHGFAELTAREREVLCRIAAGKTLKQIALEFGTSYNTVKNQRASIMEKLSAGSDADLVRMVISRQPGGFTPSLDPSQPIDGL